MVNLPYRIVRGGEEKNQVGEETSCPLTYVVRRGPVFDFLANWRLPARFKSEVGQDHFENKRSGAN
jgi:hypothetical protein